MGFNRQFHVRSVSHQPFVRFSLNITQMLLSMSCAELMTPLHRLKVTVPGHGFYPLNLVSAPYLLDPLNHFPINFTQMLISVKQ